VISWASILGASWTMPRARTSSSFKERREVLGARRCTGDGDGDNVVGGIWGVGTVNTVVIRPWHREVQSDTILMLIAGGRKHSTLLPWPMGR